MPILNYTTTIDVDKTVGEIQRILSRSGANKITMDYDYKGNPIAMTFCIIYNGSPVAFSLPCNYSGIKASMEQSNVPKAKRTDEQAFRVGWRIIKDWIEAQMAMVEAELFTTVQVFLPFAITSSGKTVFELTMSEGKLLN